MQSEIRATPKHSADYMDEIPNLDYTNCIPPMDFSVEIVIAFMQRFEMFRENVLHNPNGPLGDVTDVWYRLVISPQYDFTTK